MWDDEDRFKIDPVGDFGRAIDHSLNTAKDRVRSRVQAADYALRGRPMTSGEVGMIQAMFGINPGFARAKVFSHNFWWPFPNDRAMTPSGDIFFPSRDYEDDFSAFNVSVPRKALFMHEATHLYQWYVLKQWVILRGPFQRNYNYQLVAGQQFKGYGLEQMGQMVQDYYRLSHGGQVRGIPYRAQDYRDALPVRN